MVTPGGEVAFVSRMIDESLILRERIQWYTSMVGKLSSVGEVVERLKTVGVENWAVTEFIQGQKTRRWAVGWSWGNVRPRQVCITTLFLISRLNGFGAAVERHRMSLVILQVYLSIYYHFRASINSQCQVPLQLGASTLY